MSTCLNQTSTNDQITRREEDHTCSTPHAFHFSISQAAFDNIWVTAAKKNPDQFCQCGKKTHTPVCAKFKIPVGKRMKAAKIDTVSSSPDLFLSVCACSQTGGEGKCKRMYTEVTGSGFSQIKPSLTLTVN